jgi:pimeloyl-ACP methyl ester carboxylesterase
MQRLTVAQTSLEVEHLPAPVDAPPRAPLVFLHEGLGSVAMWRDWPRAVCAETGRAGWVYSRRGYGGSEPVVDVRGPSVQSGGVRNGRLLPDYMQQEAWAVLPALLAQLGIERPILIGHSDGGTIALLHASRHPVTACIVMAPHTIVEDVSVHSITQARDAFLTGELRQRLARYHQDVDCAFWQWNDIWLDPAFRSFDIREDCRHIAAPVLAIQGADDPYGTLAQIDGIDLPDTRITHLVLPECGHSPHRDQREAVTRHIAAFAQSLD